MEKNITAQEEVVQGLSTADWFYDNLEFYLSQPDFVNSEKDFGPGFNYRDLFHEERDGGREKIIKAQNMLISRSRFNKAIWQNHAGFLMPIFYYAGDTSFAKKFGAEPINYNPKLDYYWLISNQGDSLRRRNLLLSKLILPEKIIELSEKLGRQIKIANFGSGTGLSVLNALSDPNVRSRVESVINYDNDKSALLLGGIMLDYVRREGMIDPNVKVEYRNQSLMKTEEPFDLGEETGVICSSPNESAIKIVGRTSRNLNDGGEMIITSSNYNMEKESPFTSFHLQHGGSEEDYKNNWFLNCRKENSIRYVLETAGLPNIKLYGDSDYPGIEKISEELCTWADPLPARALGMIPKENTPKPDRSLLEKMISHNWIAIASK